MSKIVLIDGHSILNRAFFGLPDLTNAEGLHTNAVYGFLNIMFKILEEEKPDYLTVAFDVHAPTFRHDMFAEYKGTRKPMAEELREQVPLMKDVLRAMGVKTVEKAGLEADDLLGTIANRCEQKGMEVVIISGDRDLLQLATEHVLIRIPKTKRTGTEIENYYASDVKEKYLVTPKEFIDVKALMGDTSDNIPGVPNIGEKTATKIIAQYGSIENAYEHVSELKPPRASKNLMEYWEQARLSKILATINVEAEFEYNVDDAELGNLYTEEAYAYFQRLQFKNFLSRFEIKMENKLEDHFHILNTKAEAVRVFEEAMEYDRIGLSVYKDTRNVLPLFADQAGFGGIAISFDSEKTYCMKVEQISFEWIKEQLQRLIHAGKEILVFDLKEKLEWMTEDAKEQDTFYDMTIAAYLLNPLKNDYTYLDVAQEHLNVIVDEKSELEIRACYEAYTAWKSQEVLFKKLEETQMMDLYKKIEMPLVFALYHMERNGVKVEADQLKAYGTELGEKIKELEVRIYEMAGENFNINSPKQLGVILFEKLGLPNGKKTKTGYSTAADVLEKLAADYPIVSSILEYRQLSKLKSTYADGLAGYISDLDGRIHGKFNQTITATGRISSTEPNLQNIPIRMELGRMIRKVFVPEEGYVFVDADYSQIELRVLAHCSGDEQLIKAYKEAKDIHRITASQVFHTPFEEVTDLQRRNAKAVNFGIVYGISSFGLSQDLSITRKEANEYIERYFETYPGIKAFLDQMVADAKTNGYVTTLFGRRRPVPELSSSNFMQRQFGERVAMNSPIQGTAADIMKIAMIEVDRALRKNQLKSKVVLQVHDELLLEAHVDELDQVKAILKESMETAAQLLVPLEIDMHEGKNWYEAK